MIRAVIKKITSKSVILKYNTLLNAIDGKYQTNINTQKILSLVKMQLEEMPSWDIIAYSLTGSDSTKNIYTYNQLLYVMEPDESSINYAIELINNTLNASKQH